MHEESKSNNLEQHFNDENGEPHIVQGVECFGEGGCCRAGGIIEGEKNGIDENDEEDEGAKFDVVDDVHAQDAEPVVGADEVERPVNNGCMESGRV